MSSKISCCMVHVCVHGSSVCPLCTSLSNQQDEFWMSGQLLPVVSVAKEVMCTTTFLIYPIQSDTHYQVLITPFMWEHMYTVKVHRESADTEDENSHFALSATLVVDILVCVRKYNREGVGTMIYIEWSCAWCCQPDLTHLYHVHNMGYTCELTLLGFTASFHSWK